jgi:hypothetical protein
MPAGPKPGARTYRGTPKPAAAKKKSEPVGELRFGLLIDPPDNDTGAPVELHVSLREFTLAERQLAKRALAKFTDPDMEEVITVHAWVVWRRTHPESSLQNWMDHVQWGDVLDGLALDPDHVAWNTTPEGFDPEA